MLGQYHFNSVVALETQIFCFFILLWNRIFLAELLIYVLCLRTTAVCHCMSYYVMVSINTFWVLRVETHFELSSFYIFFVHCWVRLTGPPVLSGGWEWTHTTTIAACKASTVLDICICVAEGLDRHSLWQKYYASRYVASNYIVSIDLVFFLML